MTALLMRAWDFLQAGGPVMWPLLLVSLWLWSLVLRKISWLIRVRGERLSPNQAWYCLTGGESPLQGISPNVNALAGFTGQRTGKLSRDLALWQAAVRRQAPIIWRHLTEITVLAAVAPLLGLLGTVSGMIETFEVIQIHGTGNAQAMAGGISEALITTQTGLLVAIPGLFAAHILRRQARKVQGELYSFQSAVERMLSQKEAGSCSG